MGLSLPTHRTPTVNDPTRSASQRTVTSTIGYHGVNRLTNVATTYGQSDTSSYRGVNAHTTIVRNVPLSNGGDNTVHTTSVGGHYGMLSRHHTVRQHHTSRDTQSTDSDSEDSQVKKRVKISTVEYQGKDFHVTGKENVLSILRDTHSVRTMMETGQLEKLMQYEGNFVKYGKRVY